MLDFSFLATAIGIFELQFITGLILSFAIGYAIGEERESRGKDAGISTHIFVIAGSSLFTMLGVAMDPASPSRVAAQILAGIGFLCAGLILKEGANVKNLTTAASVWYAAAIGMAIGFGFYIIASLAGIAAIIVPRIPHIGRSKFDKK